MSKFKKDGKSYDNTKTKRIENSLKMLGFLKEAAKEGTRLNSNQLKEKLGITNTRTIYYYRQTLEMFGYNIVSYGGWDGGYELILPQRLTEAEISWLSEIIPANKIEVFEKIKQLNKDFY